MRGMVEGTGPIGKKKGLQLKAGGRRFRGGSAATEGDLQGGAADKDWASPQMLRANVPIITEADRC